MSALKQGSISTQRNGMIMCVVGAAASGKTTLIAKLRAEFPSDTRRVVTVTSRSMRPGEVEGESYFFVSRSEFEKRVAAGEFFEWEETHGNLYGTLRQSIEQVLESGGDMVLDIDIRGACSFRNAWPQRVVTVLVVPPSGEELVQRLKNRGAISPQELTKRIESAEREYASFRDLHHSGEAIDYLVINSQLDEAYATFRCILIAERNRISRRSTEFIANLCAISKG